MDRLEKRQAAGSRFRPAFTFLCWEGAFATAYDTLLGPTYINGLAGEIGISIALLAWLTALPWIGNIAQLGALWFLERARSPKRYTVRMAWVARSLWLVPLLLAAFWATRPGFPKRTWFIVLCATDCAGSFLGTSSGSAWQAWMKSLVPESFRGRFFGSKQRFSTLALIAANLVAGFWVGWKPHGYYAGYALVACLALGGGWMSTYLLTRVPETSGASGSPELAGLDQAAPSPQSLAHFIEALKEPLRSREFRKVLILGASFMGAVQLAGPYFPYFFTRDLGLPMSLVAVWTVMTPLAAFAFATYWGARIDELRDSKPVFRFAGLYVAIAPLFYVFITASSSRWIAPIEYFVSGLAFAGTSLALTFLLFRASPRQGSARYFAMYSAVIGTACAIANVLGGFLAQALAPWGGFRALWIVSSVARLLVIFVVMRLVYPYERTSPPIPDAIPATSSPT